MTHIYCEKWFMAGLKSNLGIKTKSFKTRSTNED